MPCLTFPADARHTANFDETLLQQAAQCMDQPVAAVWQAQQSLVVPRTYRRHAGFDTACQASAACGWPVVVRQSGGGLVPQGGGIVNFSWARALPGVAIPQTDAVYRHLCGMVANALRALGIDSYPAAVPGSFCDGRYNLAVHTAQGLRKVAGTAQLWRRIAPAPGQPPVQVVLAHAVILADIDAAVLTAHLNAFETALASTTRYEANRVIAVRDLLPASDHNIRQGLQQVLQHAVSTAPAYAYDVRR